jgi:nitronate monooxygenase
MWSTAVTEAFGIDVPIVVAPMGGGPSTPQLVATASNAGALGSLAAGYLAPARIYEDIAATRALTSQPFAVNVFVNEPVEPDPVVIERVLARLAPLRAELGLPPRPADAAAAEDLDAQLEAILAAGPKVVSFTFGVLPARWIEAFTPRVACSPAPRPPSTKPSRSRTRRSTSSPRRGTRPAPIMGRFSTTRSPRSSARSRSSRRCATLCGSP